MTTGKDDYYVYVLSRPSGIPLYVGKGRRERMIAHISEAKNGRRGHLYNVIRKILADGNEVGKRKLATGLTNEQAIALEIATIASIGRRCNGGPLVNQTDGGDGAEGYQHDLINRMKMSKARDGYKWSDETRAKFRKAMTGRSLTAEHRAKIAAGLSGPKHRMYGKKLSEEHRAILCKSRCKQVIAGGVGYESIAEAGKAIGVAAATIFYRIKVGKPGYGYVG